MTNVTPERKERIMKSLALLGLVAVIIFITWVSIQIVSVFPSAVQSLASLAESVYQYDPRAAHHITFTETPKHLTTGIAATIAWEKPFETGTYSFSYACGKDVLLEITSTESDFAGLECNTYYNLGNVNNATLTIHSDTTPSIDLEYTIAYFKTNATNESAIKTASAGIILGSEVAIGPATSVEVTVNETRITPAPSTNNIASKPAPATPTPTFTYIYTLPVSDPKGFTDLAVTYLGIGTLDAYGNFLSTGSLTENVPGAVQFSVINQGTKTSEEWTFSTSLPGNVSYNGKTQKALKPNERATFTISFPAVTGLALQKFNFTITTKNDTNSKNNTLAWSTVVLK